MSVTSPVIDRDIPHRKSVVEGGDAIDNQRDTVLAAQCDNVRKDIRADFKRAIGSGSVLQERDINEYMQGLTDTALEEGGAKDTATKLKWLKENKEKYAPRMIEEARRFSVQLRAAIEAAKTEGGLNEVNAEHLQAMLHRRSGNWQAVKEFFRENSHDLKSLNHWRSTWRDLSKRQKTVAATRKRLKLEPKDLPELLALESADYKTGKVKDRLKMLEKAEIALTEHEYGKKELYTQAQKALAPAISQHTLTQAQANAYLARKFAKYKGKALEDYVHGTLAQRARDWITDVTRFRDLVGTCEKKNIAVPSEDDFFDMSYRQRSKALMDLQKKLRDDEKPAEHPMFAQVENAMDGDDWKKARSLVQRMEEVDLTPNDRKKLFGIKQTVDANFHEEEQKKKQLPEEQTKELKRRLHECEIRFETQLLKVPEVMRDLYLWPLREGGPNKWRRMRRIMTWTYNVKWAHDHGFVKNEDDFRGIQERSTHDTERINEEGHRSTGIEMIDLETIDEKKQSVARSFGGGKSKGATYVKYSKHTFDKTKEAADAELMNERKTYWELGIADGEGVTLERMIKVNDEFHPILKEMRSLESQLGLQERTNRPYPKTLERYYQQSMN